MENLEGNSTISDMAKIAIELDWDVSLSLTPLQKDRPVIHLDMEDEHSASVSKFLSGWQKQVEAASRPTDMFLFTRGDDMVIISIYKPSLLSYLHSLAPGSTVPRCAYLSSVRGMVYEGSVYMSAG